MPLEEVRTVCHGDGTSGLDALQMTLLQVFRTATLIPFNNQLVGHSLQKLHTDL